MGYNAVADNTGLSSFAQQLLPPKSAKSREIIRTLELIAVQGHPRSSIFVSIETYIHTLIKNGSTNMLDLKQNIMRNQYHNKTQ